MDPNQLSGLLNEAWMLIAAAMVFFMQAGFMAIEAGLTQRKNNINVAAKNLADFGIAVMLFWLFGFGIMFGASSGGLGLFGASWFMPSISQSAFDSSETMAVSLGTFFIYQAMFCGTAVTIVSGATAERMRFESYLLLSICISGLIYPVFGHWAWGGFVGGHTAGWLARIGFIDFAGATVVHSIGGWSALAALILLGARRGRFLPDGTSRPMAKANLPLATLGALILWFGWFGFNGGSTLFTTGLSGAVMVNTLLAGVAGMIAIIPVRLIFNQGTIEIDYLINGALAGLVAITASAYAVSTHEAIVIGFMGAWVMLGVDALLVRLRIDDAVSAVPVHLGAGMWGTAAVALFGDPAVLGTGLSMGLQLSVQMAGIFVAGIWAFPVMLLILGLLNQFLPLRVTGEEEVLGLNITEQGAIPDFSEFPGLEELLRQRYEDMMRKNNQARYS